MKKLCFLSIICLASFSIQAQEFTKQLADARTAYASGKLDDSRFAMQQMLQNLDMIMGKEVLKLLPAKIQDHTSNTGKDNVSGTSGFMGVVVHREYGPENKSIELEIISNSPLLTSINALLSMPMIMNSGDNKVVKVSGYKALIQKNSGDNETAEYELQLPISFSLITLKAPGYSQEQIIQMANTLPVAQLAKLLQ